MIALPESRILKRDETHLCLLIGLDPALKFFEGHFPRQKLLPGVVQLMWAEAFAVKHFGLEGMRFSSSPRVKFTAPLIPGDEVRLTLRLKRDEDARVSIDFSYERVDESALVPSSSGRVVLIPEDRGGA